MSINSTLIVQLIVFLILVWFTMRFVWPPIAKALDERAEKIRHGLEAADNAKAELSAANKKVEQELEQTRKEVSGQLAAAEKRANDIVEESKRRAQIEAGKILAQAQQDAHRAVVKAREDLRDQVALLAVKGAEQILRKEVDAKVHAEMLNQLKTEL